MSHTAQMAADEVDRLRSAVEDWHDMAGRAERERDEAVNQLTRRISQMHEQRVSIDAYRALWHEACEQNDRLRAALVNAGLAYAAQRAMDMREESE